MTKCILNVLWITRLVDNVLLLGFIDQEKEDEQIPAYSAVEQWSCGRVV